MNAIKVLIIKTSSIGDVIQSFGVLEYLHARFPGIRVDWAVEASFASIIQCHPLIHKAIPLHIKARSPTQLIRDLRVLREEKYDLVFDLQKNLKSGFVTGLSRGKVKIGYGLKTVREWPNVLFTNRRFNIGTELNIRDQYIGLLKRYFSDMQEFIPSGIRLTIDESGREQIAEILKDKAGQKVMVCPGSKWVNKQLPVQTMMKFLSLIEENTKATFFLMWGDAVEKAQCEELQRVLQNSKIVDRLSLPVWQNLMAEMDIVIAVDSSALHLCGTTKSASFSVFGPTSPAIFKPIGPRHLSVQGRCPYKKNFVKQCPLLRSCSTGACIRDLKAEELYARFSELLKPIEHSILL